MATPSPMQERIAASYAAAGYAIEWDHEPSPILPERVALRITNPRYPTLPAAVWLVSWRSPYTGRIRHHAGYYSHHSNGGTIPVTRFAAQATHYLGLPK